MLRPGLQPTLEERSVVNRQVHGEADGRRGKDPQEQPALPVVERASRPEDEDDKEEGSEHSLKDRLSVERIHIKHQARTIVAAFWRRKPVFFPRNSDGQQCEYEGGRLESSGERRDTAAGRVLNPENADFQID